MQGSENIVEVEDGLNLGGDRVSELLCLYNYFEGEIDDNLEGKNIVSGIKEGERQDTEGEWLGIKYETLERVRFGKPVLGMALGTTHVSAVGSRRSGDGKYECSCVGDTM